MPPEVGDVLASMATLAAAADGWVNLLPGVPEEEVEEAPRSVFTALFGPPQPPATMGTWVPKRRGHGPTVGISHPRGRHAVRQLAELGVPVPGGWRVRQDHGRRGLVVEPLPGATDAEVLDWMLQAGRALAVMPLTGRWLAQVHLPLGGGQGLPRSTTS
ncbi:MAG: hypothetical protein ACRDYZ_01225 [Acidimicrobiales bacterium]